MVRVPLEKTTFDQTVFPQGTAALQTSLTLEGKPPGPPEMTSLHKKTHKVHKNLWEMSRLSQETFKYICAI